MEVIYKLCLNCRGTGVKNNICSDCNGTGKIPTEFFMIGGDPRKLSIQLDDLPQNERDTILPKTNPLAGIGYRAGIGNKRDIIEEHTEGEFTLKKNTLTKDLDIDKK